jgi:hypothetical protein
MMQHMTLADITLIALWAIGGGVLFAFVANRLL